MGGLMRLGVFQKLSYHFTTGKEGSLMLYVGNAMINHSTVNAIDLLNTNVVGPVN